MLTTQHHLTGTLKQLGVAALYALLLYVGDLYFESETIVGYFEPASGLALAALLIGGKRYVWGVFLGATLINAISTNSFWAAATITSCDVLQAFCGAWLLTREGLGFDLRLQSLRTYLRLILLGGCAGIAIGALAVNSALLFSRLLTPENYFHSLVQWWMSDTLGVILIAPLILVWWRAKNDWREAGQMAEAALLLGLTVLAGQIVFLGWLHDSVGQVAKGYWMFMILSWVAVRLGTRGTVIALLVVAVQALLGAIHGTGFFADDIAKTHLANYWLYMVTLSAVSMALATHFTERKQIEAALRNRTGELALHNHIFKQVSLGIPLGEILEDLARQVENQNPGMLCSILLPGEDGKHLRYGAAPGLPDYCNRPIKGGDERVLGTFSIYRHKQAQPSDTEIDLIEHYADLAAQVIGRVRIRDDLHLKNLALNAAANAVVITDKNSKIEWVNQAFGKLTGYSAAEAIGHYSKELVKSGEHSQAYYEELWQTIISGKVWHGEIINRRKGGSLYHEEMTITPVANEHGEITHFVAVKQEITDRVKAGLALSRYKLVIDTVNDGFWMVDAMGNLLEANAVYAKMSGYPIDELVNMHISQLEATEQSVEEVGAHARKIIAQGCARFETRHRHKDGHEIDVEVSATFMPEPQQFFVFIRDITERKRAEIALRESEANQRAILNNSPYMAWLKDPEGRYMKVNKGYVDYIRQEDARQVVGKTDFDLWPKELAEKYRADDAEVMASRQQKHVEEPSLDGDKMHWVETFKTPVIDESGNVLGTTGIARDITGRKQMEQSLRSSEERFRQLAENIREVFWMTDPAKGKMLYISPAYEHVWGRTLQSLYDSPRAWLEAIHDEDRQRVLQAALTRQSAGLYDEEYRIVRPNGDVRWIHDRAFPVRDSGGAVYRIVGVAEDITERRLAENETKEAQERFEMIFNATPDTAVISRLQDGCITNINDAFTELSGHPVGEAIGSSTIGLNLWVNHGDREKFINELRAKGVCKNLEAQFQSKDGKQYTGLLSAKITFLQGVQHIISITRDITERKKAEEQIHNLAFYDTLTQLPNRRLLNDRLGQTMAAGKRSGRYGALMFLDLDNFKPLNDAHGHDVGDLLLMEVACRITGCVREADTVARFGGDEFVVILGELDVDKAESTTQAGLVAEKIRSALAEPYLLKIQQEGKAETIVEHRCAASIGVVVFNSEAAMGDVLKWADAAMYQAKEGGRNLICFHK